MEKRFAEQPIVAILKECEASVVVKEICRKYSISDATFYTWRRGYNEQRPHSLLGYLTPAEFAVKKRQQNMDFLGYQANEYLLDFTEICMTLARDSSGE